MSPTTQYFISILIVSSVYFFGKVSFTVFFKLHGAGIQLGFSPSLFRFKIGGLTIGIGIVIPLPYLFKIYELDEDGQKVGELRSAALFHNVSLIKRMMTVMSGVFALIVGAVLLLSARSMIYPKQILTVEEVNKLGIYPSKLGEEIGFRKGDRLLAINGKSPFEFHDYLKVEEWLEEPARVQVGRGERTVTIVFPDDFLDRLSLSSADEGPLFSAQMPVELGSVIQGSTAMRAGLMVGDRIVQADSMAISSCQELIALLKNHKGEDVVLRVVREGYNESIKITVRVDEYGRIGVSFSSLLTYTKQERSVAEAFVDGMTGPYEMMIKQVTGFKKIFGGQTSKSISPPAPIGMAKLFGDQMQTERFLVILGMLMAMWACMNLLPLPFAAILALFPLISEAITGKPASIVGLRRVEKFAWFVILGLMAFSFGNDIVRLFM